MMSHPDSVILYSVLTELLDIPPCEVREFVFRIDLGPFGFNKLVRYFVVVVLHRTDDSDYDRR